MTYTIRKTDRRMNGYNNFTYVAYTNMASEVKFILTRNWCWQTWGPSCELHLFNKLKISEAFTDEWCWETEFGVLRLYFKSDKEANWFKLKWL